MTAVGRRFRLQNQADANGSGSASFDPRLFAYRHGTNKSGESVEADSYKMNCAFFDGHVELLGDLESADPNLWWPKNSQLEIDSKEAWNDVLQRYMGGTSYGTSNYYHVPY